MSMSVHNTGNSITLGFVAGNNPWWYWCDDWWRSSAHCIYQWPV